MSARRAQRFCKKCRRQTQHELSNKGRTCEVCKTFTTKAEDAVSIYDVGSKLKQ